MIKKGNGVTLIIKRTMVPYHIVLVCLQHVRQFLVPPQIPHCSANDTSLFDTAQQ